jgi:hypothetical protein
MPNYVLQGDGQERFKNFAQLGWLLRFQYAADMWFNLTNERSLLQPDRRFSSNAPKSEILWFQALRKLALF